MQIDRVPPGIRSRPVTFLGGEGRAPEGPLMLAALTGAPVLPVFTRRRGFMRYEAVVSPPIRIGRRPSDHDLDIGAQQMMAAMERFIREHPTQWFHFV
jgi:KDO2-lipid IV(A) lauroyltransferase